MCPNLFTIDTHTTSSSHNLPSLLLNLQICQCLCHILLAIYPCTFHSPLLPPLPLLPQSIVTPSRFRGYIYFHTCLAVSLTAAGSCTKIILSVSAVSTSEIGKWEVGNEIHNFLRNGHSRNLIYL